MTAARQIGILGLGLLGSALAHRLIGAGFDPKGFDIDAAKTAAFAKAGGIATLINGWWEAHELEQALGLTEPKLILTDAARGRSATHAPTPTARLAPGPSDRQPRAGRRAPARRGP